MDSKKRSRSRSRSAEHAEHTEQAQPPAGVDSLDVSISNNKKRKYVAGFEKSNFAIYCNEDPEQPPFWFQRDEVMKTSPKWKATLEMDPTVTEIRYTNADGIDPEIMGNLLRIDRRGNDFDYSELYPNEFDRDIRKDLISHFALAERLAIDKASKSIVHHLCVELDDEWSDRKMAQEDRVKISRFIFDLVEQAYRLRRPENERLWKRALNWIRIHLTWLVQEEKASPKQMSSWMHADLWSYLALHEAHLCAKACGKECDICRWMDSEEEQKKRRNAIHEEEEEE